MKVDYQVYGTEEVNNETLNDELTKAFTSEPSVQSFTGSDSFTGQIDPKSQTLQGITSNMSSVKAISISQNSKWYLVLYQEPVFWKLFIAVIDVLNNKGEEEEGRLQEYKDNNQNNDIKKMEKNYFPPNLFAYFN